MFTSIHIFSSLQYLSLKLSLISIFSEYKDIMLVLCCGTMKRLKLIKEKLYILGPTTSIMRCSAQNSTAQKLSGLITKSLVNELRLLKDSHPLSSLLCFETLTSFPERIILLPSSFPKNLCIVRRSE